MAAIAADVAVTRQHIVIVVLGASRSRAAVVVNEVSGQDVVEIGQTGPALQASAQFGDVARNCCAATGVVR